MTGIYIHIPYCKKVCYYCDFHFSVSLKDKDALLQAVIIEMDMRKEYLNSRNIDTIYFGGGTPTVLSIKELESILNKINALYNVNSKAEITIEANPDDLNPEYLKALKTLGFNRLSIGIQSFFDEDLKWMNRRHNAQEAENSIKLSQDNGFSNINLDLIYGLPELSEKRWKENLEKFLKLDVPHLSAYHLTIEPKTVFGYYQRKGRLTEIGEEQSLQHYKVLMETMKANAYEHYEISNFCKEGLYSRHNTNYWKQGTYLGIGPSAHSFNGQSRQWNSSVNSDYIKTINNGQLPFEVEQLTEKERFNDYLLTGFRTIWGIDMDYIFNTFGSIYGKHLEEELFKIIDNQYIIQEGKKIRLSEEGMFVSDQIISGLMLV